MSKTVRPESSFAGWWGLMEASNPDLARLIESEDEAMFVQVTEAALDRFLRTIENGAKEYTRLGERGLSRLLTDLLNSAGWQATAERDHNGHVDVVVEHLFRRQWKYLGECKIHDGYEYHVKGCGQLIGYFTGREQRGFCLDFFKVPAMFAKLLSIRSRMDSESPLAQVGRCRDHIIKGAFISSHTHPTHSLVEILHVGCSLKPGA